MDTRKAIIDSIYVAFRVIYPEFPIQISESPDDRRVLCARIFAVPSDRISEIKAAIRRIGRDLITDGDYLLLPMVKNIGATKEHYPAFLPQEQERKYVAILHRFLEETPLEPYSHRPLAAIDVAVIDAISLSMPALHEMNLARSVCEELQSQPSHVDEVAVTQELAMAA